MQLQVQGIHHIALVCKDIEQTVDFYTTTLGFNLTGVKALPEGGNHCFLALNDGTEIAFSGFSMRQNLRRELLL